MPRPEPLSVSFFVPGVPISQGSKRLIGKQMVESSRKLRPWRAKVAWAAEEAMKGKTLLDEPLWMAALFCFWRPKAHYRSGKFAEFLKPSAPSHPPTYPDLEKLVRATNDAMEGIVFRNDSLIVRLFAEKVYRERLGVWISIGTIDAPMPNRLVEASGGDIHQASAVERMIERAVH